MVPRTGPLSASSALVIRSWYQRGKSSARGVSTRATSAQLSGSASAPRRLPVVAGGGAFFAARGGHGQAAEPPTHISGSLPDAPAQDDPPRRQQGGKIETRVRV